MKIAEQHPMDLAISGRIGIGWGCSGGEAGGMITDSYLAADGIENVIRVLEDLEDEKFAKLQFIELNACSGGCVGGVLNVEILMLPKPRSTSEQISSGGQNPQRDIPQKVELGWHTTVEYEPVFRLVIPCLRASPR